MWEPTQGKRSPRRPTKTLLKTLIESAGVNNQERANQLYAGQSCVVSHC